MRKLIGRLKEGREKRKERREGAEGKKERRGSVLVTVSIAVKRHLDKDNAYKGQHLIGTSL